ncbi:kinesin motor domain-containing protein, partial [Baffinella frigidus]
DNVFPPITTTDQIYKQVLSDIVVSTVEGYNGCIFAYGQTSSGKTHTMTGTRSHPGVFTLASQEVFSHVQRLPDREFFFRLSYIEIYNEVVIDLLDPTKTGLQIRSSEAGANSVVKIVGVTEKVVTSEKEVLATVAMGEAHRSVGSTDMNEKSSRSHTILRLTIESKKKLLTWTLTLQVDLAGSESAAKSGGDGQRRAEGSYINKSLLTLATVIQRLITASGHIPYRDSKLTRILEPALGGNSSTAIICTITPAQHHLAETMNTLKFAAR